MELRAVYMAFKPNTIFSITIFKLHNIFHSLYKRRQLIIVHLLFSTCLTEISTKCTSHDLFLCQTGSRAMILRSFARATYVVL